MNLICLKKKIVVDKNSDLVKLLIDKNILSITAKFYNSKLKNSEVTSKLDSDINRYMLLNFQQMLKYFDLYSTFEKIKNNN
jgi:hypothetical protein